ncbi:MAG: hypothetical protein ABTQ31_12765 [Rhizobiaceae bacterium]
MRALVAAACIAIIAAVGYYFWSEYSTYRQAELRHAQYTSAVEKETCLAAVVAYEKHMTETVAANKFETAKPLRTKAERCAVVLQSKFGIEVVVGQYGARIITQ